MQGHDMLAFSNFFCGKKVLITGHTGFKGSWLAIWLRMLGADVHGLSNGVPTQPSLFEQLSLEADIHHNVADIRDVNAVKHVFDTVHPDILLHLAAQPIVHRSYEDPVETWATTTLGTVHLLECLRKTSGHCISVFITSDKAYKNKEWLWGYRENDELGGDDPYSASKAGAELAISSYYQSFLKHLPNQRIGIARAGNVIGGGDWAENRLVPDCIRSWSRAESVTLRAPGSTRPWQHVLEPLSGYMLLAHSLSTKQNLVGEAFNFGPVQNKSYSVEAVVNRMSREWTGSKWQLEESRFANNKECSLLQLSCEKALHLLNWSPILEFDETIRLTMDWYIAENNNVNMSTFTTDQIAAYMKSASDKSASWMS